jgi:predicted small metal-binding protein
MLIELRCEDLGLECKQVIHGHTEEEVIETLMRHIDLDHDSDWFDLEEVYVTARVTMRRVAA